MSGLHFDGATDALPDQGAPKAAIVPQNIADRFAGCSVIPAYVLPSAEGRSQQAVIRCDQCEDFHYHGADGSHRCPHCTIPDSGYQRLGYILEIRGACRSEQDILPAAPFAGHRRLRTVMRQAASDLRRVILRHLLDLRRAGDTIDRNIHGYQVSVLGRASYAIYPPPSPRGGAARRLKARPAPRIGAGLSRLAADVYGVSHGVALFRMLQALTLSDFDPQFQRELAALVDAFDERCGLAADLQRGSVK